MSTNASDLDRSTAATSTVSVTDEARRAIEEMLVAHREEFRRFTRRRVTDVALADDLLQQVSLRAIERAADLRDPEKARAWIYTMLRRVIVDARGAREIPVSEVPDHGDAETVEDHGPTACRCSVAILESLKPEYREALQRVELGDEPIADVASDLGITTNNATVRLHRARHSMKTKLMDRCGVSTARACLDCSCDDHPCGTST